MLNVQCEAADSEAFIIEHATLNMRERESAKR
jgi:hypothetical protein